MPLIEIIIAVTIHFITPLIGLIIFILITKKMKSGKVIDPPTTELFIIFSTYGILIISILTTFFWKWSGMASLGAFYLILIAPFIMGIIAYRNYKRKELSIYHLRIYKAGLFYFIIFPLTIGMIFILK